MGVVQSVGNAYSGVSITATLGSTPTVGNTLVAIGNSDSTLTIDGTWNLRRSFVSDQGFYVWDKVAGGSEPTIVTVTPDGGADYAALIVVEMDGVSEFDDVGTVGSHHGAASTITAPSVASSADSDLALVIAAMHGGWDSTGAPSSPVFDNGFTDLESAIPVFTGSAGFVCALFVGYQELGAAGEIGDSTVTWSVSTANNQAGVLVAYKAGNSVSGALGVNFNLLASAVRVAFVTGHLDVDMHLVGEVEDVETATVTASLGLAMALSPSSSKVVAVTGPLGLGVALHGAAVKVVAVTGVLTLDLRLSGRDPSNDRDITLIVAAPVGNWAVAAPSGQWAAAAPVAPGWAMTAAGGGWAIGPPTS